MNHVIEHLLKLLRKMDRDSFLNAHGPIVLIISYACNEIVYLLEITSYVTPFVLAC
jgi:hypothetical protein